MFRHFFKILKSMKGIYPSTTYRVIDITGEPKNKNLQVIYQVSGKATIVKEKPEVLISELMALRGFSRKDTMLIYELAMDEKIMPAFRIVNIFFETIPAKFEIEDIRSKYTLSLTAEEIINANELLGNFSTSHIKMIYFQFTRENEKQKNIFTHKIYPEDGKGMHMLRIVD